jgi:hypothetical protein
MSTEVFCLGKALAAAFEGTLVLLKQRYQELITLEHQQQVWDHQIIHLPISN